MGAIAEEIKLASLPLALRLLLSNPAFTAEDVDAVTLVVSRIVQGVAGRQVDPSGRRHGLPRASVWSLRPGVSTSVW